MRVAKTLVAAFLVIVLVASLARGEGHGSCQKVLGLSQVVMRKENSNVSCVRRKWHMKCAGLCDSKSTVVMKDGAVHWNHDCECCQAIGHESKLVNLSMPCTDGSSESVQVVLFFPERCQCTDC